MTPSPEPPVQHHFGAFVADPADRRLLRDGEPVELRPKVLEAMPRAAAAAGCEQLRGLTLAAAGRIEAERESDAALADLGPDAGPHLRASALAVRGVARALQGRAHAAGADFDAAGELFADYPGPLRFRWRILRLLLDPADEARAELRAIGRERVVAEERLLRTLHAFVTERLQGPSPG